MLAHCSCGKRNMPSVQEWKLHFLNVTPRGNRSLVSKGGTPEHQLIRKQPVTAEKPEEVCGCFLSFTGQWDNTCCPIEKHRKLRGKDPRGRKRHPRGCSCTPCLDVQRKGLG